MNNFVTYQVALELVRALRPIVEQLRTNSSDLANQIERAGTSLVLNLGEGIGAPVKIDAACAMTKTAC